VTWKSLLSVALGGALGTLARFGVELSLDSHPEVGLAVVNLGGAALLGLTVGHGINHLPQWVREGITVGFLGAFTTMSGLAVLGIITPLSFSVPYIFATFIFGVGMAGLGYYLGHRLRGKRT
jgi:fluoride exporter